MIKNVLLQDLTLARSNLQKFNVANEELGRSCRGHELPGSGLALQHFNPAHHC